LDFDGADSKAEFGLSPNGDPKLSLYEKGNLRAVLGTTELQTTRTGQTVKRPASSLVFFDKEEKVLWQVP
jgi:hypothetical protein